MKYLPRRSDYPWDRYWDSIIAEIECRLREAEIMHLACLAPLRQIKSVRSIPSYYLDKDNNGDPLFADLDPPLYLSTHYRAEDLEFLKHLSLGRITSGEILDRLEHDLSLPASRMKLVGDNCWHDRVA